MGLPATRRGRVFGGLLLAALAGSVLSAVLDSRLRPLTGLTRAVFDGPGFTGRVVDRGPARTVDLALLDLDPRLPRRRFSIRWTGVWHVPRTGDYDLLLGADDRATVTIDGRRVHERGGRLGMGTVAERVTLEAGFHALDIGYEQDGGGSHLNLQWAPAGGPPAPLDPDTLFPDEPNSATWRLGRLAAAVERGAAAAWVVTLGAAAWILGAPLARAGWRRRATWRGPWPAVAWRLRETRARTGRAWAVVAAALPVLVVLYAAALRADALLIRYGPLTEPAWAGAVAAAAGDLLPHLRPASFGWAPVANPYAGADPINYIRFAREMESFYGAHVREPVFPFVTRLFLWLLNQQDVAVSFASAFFSVLAVWATWRLGAYAFTPAVGLVAATAMAVERNLIFWGVGGWRDDAFTFFVVLSAHTLLRAHREPTHRNAVRAGVVAGLACLTRITSLSFLGPGLAWLALAPAARDARSRRRAAAVAALTMTVVAAPYLINCWRVYGDPLYAISAHTEFYQRRAGVTPQADLGAVAYVGAMFTDRPVATLRTMVAGVTSYPFANKWTGFDPWLAGSGRWLAASALVGLLLFVGSTPGRLLLLVLVTGLIPYAFTWTIPGGAEWRFTAHAYPFLLIAAGWTPVWAMRRARAAAMRRRTASDHRI